MNASASPSVDPSVRAAQIVIRDLKDRRDLTFRGIGRSIGYRDGATVGRFLKGLHFGDPIAFVQRVEKTYPAEYAAALDKARAEKPRTKKAPPKGSPHFHLQNAEKSLRLLRASLRIRIRFNEAACDHRSRRGRK